MMDWADLAKTVVGLGAPLIGEALGGPFGAAAGKILAQALTAADGTPAAVRDAISTADPAIAAAAAAKAEAEWAAMLAQARVRSSRSVRPSAPRSPAAIRCSVGGGRSTRSNF